MPPAYGIIAAHEDEDRKSWVCLFLPPWCLKCCVTHSRDSVALTGGGRERERERESFPIDAPIAWEFLDLFH